MEDQNLHLFLGPPDTTGVTQLLDQINQALHTHYRDSKRELFTNEMIINREQFMAILADIWSSWTNSDTIQRAAKRVGISKDGLNIDWMQQDKFEKAEKLIENEKPLTPTKCSTTLLK